jgi:hypothetical protein
LLAEMFRAVAVIVRSGRRNRPAISQPAPRDSADRATRMAPALMIWSRTSALAWARIAGVTLTGSEDLIVSTGTRSTTPQAAKNPA